MIAIFTPRYLPNGKEFFDAVIADLTFVTAAEFLDDDTEEELLERFIHVGGPLSIRNVFVNGKEVVNKN